MTAEHHREFDLENRERLIRMEEAAKSTKHDLTAHISREEKQEERWLSMFQQLFDQHRELKNELAAMHRNLDSRIDVIREEQASRKGAEKALLWLGGLMFTGGSSALAWVVSHWPNK
jgi:hypothetical protein